MEGGHQVADFGHWNNWSHWERSDPRQKTTITGDPGVVGHKTVWDGKNDFMGKFFGLVMGMEGMIGKAYENSLANLKQVAEADALAAKAAAAKSADAAQPAPAAP